MTWTNATLVLAGLNVIAAAVVGQTAMDHTVGWVLGLILAVDAVALLCLAARLHRS